MTHAIASQVTYKVDASLRFTATLLLGQRIGLAGRLVLYVDGKHVDQAMFDLLPE
jgi:hypothetical protein